MPYETKGQEKNKENICDSITAERVRRVIKGVSKTKDENLRKGFGGTFSYFKLGVDRFPNVEFPFVIVTTHRHGAYHLRDEDARIAALSQP